MTALKLLFKYLPFGRYVKTNLASAAYLLFFVHAHYIYANDRAFPVWRLSVFNEQSAARHPGDANHGIIFMPMLFFAILKYGLKLFRKPKPNPFAGQKIEIDMVIKVKHTFQSFFKVMVSQVLDSVPLYPFLFIIGLGNLVFAISYFTGNPMELKEFPALQTGIGVALTALPFSFYFQLKKLFNSHPRFHEVIENHFTNESLVIKGESFESKLGWSTFHKFQELKNAFMLYESKAIAIMIPKSSFENELSITTLRTFLLSLQK
ncbi:MAG: YcxB family protein [Chitinophagales bacterium]|nr:YcxB family protein [Chitinophagales bacterium]